MKPIEISQALKGAIPHIVDEQCEVLDLLTDSRHVSDVSRTLFFAIPTKRNTGCRFVQDIYKRGGRNFVVPNDAPEEYIQQFQRCSLANFWYVKDVVLALQ